MRIHRVNAQAFGPLERARLELGDGMTVVVGDNESAKSSWHAAIYAALCGRRRGRGAPRKEEHRFIELHRPWDSDDWLVTAEVTLDDGRRVEFHQDLAGKVDCHAKDLALGSDLSSEVMNEGAPDGARWLGLDRSSFLATACVEQAHMLRVLTDADGLQEHLQRAAATAGTDATAAAALERLEEFKREHVGLDRVNSSKPLRRGMNALQAAETALDQARSSHEEYLTRSERLEGLQEGAHQARQLVRVHEAAAAAYEARRLAERLGAAEELHARFGGSRPANVSDDDQVANTVSSALASWRSAPTPGTRPTPSSAEIDEEIRSLPVAPDGDTAVHESVRRAQERVGRVQARLQQHDRNRPASEDSAAVPRVAAGDDELLDLARILEMPLPAMPDDLLSDSRAARASETKPRPDRPSLPLLGAAALLLALGVVLAVIGQVPIGLGVAAVGVVVGVVAAFRRRPTAPDEAARARDAARQARTSAAREQVLAQQRRREAAVSRCAELGLSAEPAALRAVPVARAREAARADELERWSAQREALVGELASAAGELAGALSARGHAVEGADADQLHEAAEAYRGECEAHARQASASARRPDLLRQRDDTLAAERRFAEDVRGRAAAADQLLAAAKRCGIEVETPEQAVASLEDWESVRSQTLAQLDADRQEWSRLQALLDGRTLEELRELASRAAEKATALAEKVPAEALSVVDEKTASSRLPELRAEANEALSLAAAASGELRLFAASIPSVAEAEETLEEARRELDRVRELEHTLDLTSSFLGAAQERVHRDIAPRIADTVREWLPKVTGGRYADVIVSPTTLEVQVKGASGRWRQADVLSYGTAEQVYLLLRVALVEHLTKGHDTCPLLLDDITVHADADRTAALLDLLLELSKERQIVLFTQEERVATWAREHLTGASDRLIELGDPVAA